MTDTPDLPRYDRSRTYAWNYENAPPPVDADVPEVPGDWTYCGLPVASPLGIPAGPLLNGRWCLYYASLGFDVLTYKTVRSRERSCYPRPNLQPVRCGELSGGEADLAAVDAMAPDGSWAVAFGMPSKSPAVWRADVERTRAELAPGKVLSVSVVASVEDGWGLDDLANDYALCARWAAESGADAVEMNFSCPNVSTADGQLYQRPADAAFVAARVRAEVGPIPLLVKIGHVESLADARELVARVAPSVDGLAMTNSIAATVVDAAGERLFDGERRGICGGAIREASLRQLRRFREVVDGASLPLALVAVGGAASADHVERYLNAGAGAVQSATAAMVDPGIGLAIRRDLAARLPPAGSETRPTAPGADP